jgi:transcriptional regulator with XRE-family HTH domain
MQRPSSSVEGRKERAFGRILREIRQERGLSQEQLGSTAGITGYISFLERAKKNPTLSTVFDLAEASGGPIEVILRKLRFSAVLKILKNVCEVQPTVNNAPGSPRDNVCVAARFPKLPKALRCCYDRQQLGCGSTWFDRASILTV